MNNNRTYYGEYSLAYWIQMILKRNIVLPEYQRTFVWNKDDYTNLIDSFKEKQFIPPVTIGAYKTANGQDNLIIDGHRDLHPYSWHTSNVSPKRRQDLGI